MVFQTIVQVKEMLDNFGPKARTMPAPYPIVDCEKQSAAGLTCNSVIQSSMEPAGNNQCSHWTGVPFQGACNARPLDTVGVGSSN
mmetsp:Transcript_17690/g.27369  ORF Transcript_17690/g.27369 Transcript_17690/m.27369 type:complete len:85 (+) Transcript_17690:218-472(+)